MSIKRVALCLSIVLVGANAYSEDTLKVYGRINKEVRYIKQNSEVVNHETIMSTDTTGAESAFGVMGQFQPEGDSLKISYNALLGINSNVDTGATESRIRIRIAKAGISDSWGSLYLGQDFTAGDYLIFQVDPFHLSAGQNYNLDDSFTKGGSTFAYVRGTGVQVRGFTDMVQYVSPNWNGWTYTVSHDTNNVNYTNTTAADQSYLEHTLSFNGKVGEDQQLVAGFVFGKASVENSTQNSAYENQYWTLAGRYSVANFGLSLAYGTELVLPGVEYNRYMGGLTYKVSDKWTLATSYGKVDLGDTHTRATGVIYNGSESQLALGGFYQLRPSTALRVLWVQQKVERDTGAEFDLGDGLTDNTENTSQIVAMGITVKF